MKFFRVAATVFVAVGVVWHATASAFALSAVKTEILPQSPLIITGYQTRSAGTDLAFVGLYNSGDTVIDLHQWHVVDIANNRSLGLETAYTGYLAPKHHVALSIPNAVVGATYRIAGWNTTSLTPDIIAKLTTLRVERADTEHLYRPVDITSIKTNDMPQIRAYGVSSYNATFEEKKDAMTVWDDGLYEAPSAPTLRIVEAYPYSSDCAPNDVSILCGDYVKLQNVGSMPQLLDDLVLRTSSSSSSATSANTFTLSGVLAPGDYYTVWQTDAGGRISLTNSGGYVWIEDLWGLEQYADTMMHYESASSSQQGYTYAQDDAGLWQWTSTPQPSGENIITPPVVIVAPCPEGQYRNLDTNRCRKIEEVLSELSACEEGYERNPTTNRCRKLTAATTSSLTPCKEGQVRNPDTNRCRSIASEVADLLPCNDGYERNPETNRCRKVQGGEVKGAQYPVEPIAQGSGNTAGMWTLVGIVGIAAAYGVWEWRTEIGMAARSASTRLLWWRK